MYHTVHKADYTVSVCYTSLRRVSSGRRSLVQLDVSRWEGDRDIPTRTYSHLLDMRQSGIARKMQDR